MRYLVMVLAFSASVLALPVQAQGEMWVEELKQEWANPDNARYLCSYESTRLAQDPDTGKWVEDQTISQFSSQPLDYATFLACERGAAGLWGMIIEAWAGYIMGDPNTDPQLKALIMQLTGEAP